jgi:hypothetical protein
LPFEPVNGPRLAVLKAERAVARATWQEGSAQFDLKRRRAQIAARYALQRIDLASAVHAAELQLPESWIPFVVSR